MRLWFHVMQDDSTTCPIIMSEAQYEAYLRNPEQHPIRSKKVIPFNSVDGGHGSMDLSLDLKQDLEVVKAKLDSDVIDLWELKVSRGVRFGFFDFSKFRFPENDSRSVC